MVYPDTNRSVFYSPTDSLTSTRNPSKTLYSWTSGDSDEQNKSLPCTGSPRMDRRRWRLTNKACLVQEVLLDRPAQEKAGFWLCKNTASSQALCPPVVPRGSLLPLSYARKAFLSTPEQMSSAQQGTTIRSKGTRTGSGNFHPFGHPTKMGAQVAAAR